LSATLPAGAAGKRRATTTTPRARPSRKTKYILTHIDEFNQLSDEEKAELKERIRHRRCVAKKISK